MANYLDRAISTVAPAWGAKRATARAMIEGIEHAQAIYDGAAKSWRVHGRHIPASSANAEIMWSLGRLRDVSRDLRRNNAVAANCVTVIASHVVGAGIVPALTMDAGKRLKTKLQALIKAHLETTAIDFDGRHDFYGLQRLVIDTVVESGEALIVRYVPPASLRLPAPLQIRVLEPDYLDITKSGPADSGGAIFEGIEVDAAGRRVAYWLYDEHPGGALNWRLPISRRVPAGDVRHVYRQDRPGQMRGVPWCAPVIVTLRDLHDYEEADLVRQKIAACFAVFLEGAESQNLGQQIEHHKSTIGNIAERLEPGLIQRLPNGIKATFATPPTVSGQAEFVSSKLHRVCAGYGVPFELGTGILREVSFISGRIGQQQFNRNVDQWRWHMMIPHACAGVGAWFLEAAAIALGATLDGAGFKWTPPKREMLEPSKEVPAARDAIRSTLMSQSEAIRSLGDDPETVFAEIAKDNQEMDRLKIMSDSDGRRPLNWKPTPPEKADGT